MQADLKIKTKSGWEGTVTLTVPLNHKRTLVLSKCRAHQLMDSKKIKALETEEEREAAGDKNLDIMAAIYEAAREYIVAVDLKGPDGETCTNVEEFETRRGLENCFVDIASKFSQGFGPEKK